jgi:hypothetical protein
MPPRKRAAAAANATDATPKDVLTIEITDGPAKGTIFDKNVRPAPLASRPLRRLVFVPPSPALCLSDRRARFPSRRAR